MRVCSSQLLLATTLATACSGSGVPGEDDSADTSVEPPSVADIDGNSYPTLAFGEQRWMAANLMTTHLRDGTPLRPHAAGERWYGDGAAYQWGDTSDLNSQYPQALPHNYFGAAYNEDALLTGLLCPEDWRLPTVADFELLEAFVAAEATDVSVSAALKSEAGWMPSSGGGLDRFGFEGRPAGYVASTGNVTGTSVIATFATAEATSTERSTASLYDEAGITYAPNAVQLGAFVRCIAD